MEREYYVGPFAKDSDDDSDKESSSSGDTPEYSFEGFNIEFNEKISLTPVTEEKKTK